MRKLVLACLVICLICSGLNALAQGIKNMKLHHQKVQCVEPKYTDLNGQCYFTDKH